MLESAKTYKNKLKDFILTSHSHRESLQPPSVRENRKIDMRTQNQMGTSES